MLPLFSPNAPPLEQKLHLCGKKFPTASRATLRLRLKVNRPPKPGSVAPKAGFVIEVKCTPNSNFGTSSDCACASSVYDDKQNMVTTAAKSVFIFISISLVVGPSWTLSGLM